MLDVLRSTIMVFGELYVTTGLATKMRMSPAICWDLGNYMYCLFLISDDPC